MSDAKSARATRSKKRRRRRPIPGALKAIAGLVIVAIVFLVAAILGGGGSSQSSSEHASAPAPTGESAPQVETPAAAAAEELGYPSFATNNTTRVGGSDPATTAAGVALAVFPSTTPAQRPAAVTLVDEADWQGAIAASVLMATPVKAPLLVSTNGDLPDPTAQALEALDPQGSKATGKAQVFPIGDAAAPDGLKATTVEPGAPAAVAASIAELRDKLFGSPPQHIVLAPEKDPAFAMPAAAWAARSGDPVLFTEAEKLPAATVAALKRHPKVPVYLLGPSSAISSGVFREVAKIDKQVRRVSGEDPVENAIALARYAGGGFGWNVNDPGHGFVVARSDSPLDAALAAPLSASGTWGPLLLTDDADTLPKALREYLLDVKPGYTTDPTRAFYNHVWVIGDQEAIDVNQQAEIDQLAELVRIGGEP
ncbi:MAG TPA: cell wall-binding repeat-containing protein [Solirubrobacterales bacterium]|nr:cell wall-binding repeat-containing protein [Solirubrobacterales bacterium]